MGSDFKGLFLPVEEIFFLPTYFVFASDTQYPSRFGP